MIPKSEAEDGGESGSRDAEGGRSEGCGMVRVEVDLSRSCVSANPQHVAGSPAFDVTEHARYAFAAAAGGL